MVHQVAVRLSSSTCIKTEQSVPVWLAVSQNLVKEEETETPANKEHVLAW